MNAFLAYLKARVTDPSFLPSALLVVNAAVNRDYGTAATGAIGIVTGLTPDTTIRAAMSKVVPTAK